MTRRFIGINIKTAIIAFSLAPLVLIISDCGQDDSRVASPPGDGISSDIVTALDAEGTPALACWDFNEAGGSTAGDNCGARDGDVVGASWTSGACGSALAFNGSDADQQYVSVPGGDWLTQSKGTIVAWIKIHPDETGARIISTEAAGWRNGLHMTYGTETSGDLPLNGGILCGIHSTEGGNHYAEIYIDDVSKGQWHFIAFAWDGDANSILVFVDGAHSEVISAHSGIVDTGEPLTVGCWQNTGYGIGRGAWFNGLVDEVRFYDRVLSIDELNEQYTLCAPLDIRFDVKPGSCPNPLNPKSKGKLPTAILGSDGFDVGDIDVSSLLLEGVAPVKSSVEDVSTPVGQGDECDCTEDGPDGYEDLTLKFQTQEIIAAIGPVAPGDTKGLRISGRLHDGTPFEAGDCVVIVGGLSSAPCGASWQKSDSNPIMSPGFSGGSFDEMALRSASVLYDPIETRYQMWYSGQDNSGPPRVRIGYATSPEGLTWTPHGPDPVVDLGPSGAFDDWHAYFPTVIKDGSTYKMWYTGDGYAVHYLGYATSPDGVNWTKYPGSQYGGSIINWRNEGWNRYTLATTVIKEGSEYKMWFGEYGGSQGVGYATSSDGINWTVAGQVLTIGEAGQFDEWRIFYPSVVYDGSQYLMLYTGQTTTEAQRFGLATSPDGITWTKYPGNPVLPMGSNGEWEDVGQYHPHLFLDAGTLRMWYAASSEITVSLGYAESNCSKARSGKNNWGGSITFEN